MTNVTFVFLLTIWTADNHIPQVYVMDSAMTGEDCIEAVLEYNATTPNWSHGNPSCEIDLAGPEYK